MATDEPSMAVNGNYAQPQTQGYGNPEQNYTSRTANNSALATAEYGGVSGAANAAGGGAGGGNADIPKDEVGWYFVEQYYTTLSRSPEKLYLFYNKRSQFVSGLETEKVSVCVGQKAINDRIKDLDIQDCKVRVTNVDSQASGQNIVIQVIGEMSNRSQPQRKFTQTFVLAEQTNGYFVLNDIFRYIADEEEELEGEELQRTQIEAASGYQEPNVALPETVPHTLTNSTDPAELEQNAAIVDRKLEEVVKDDPDVVEAIPATVNGDEIPAYADLAQADNVTDEMIVDAPSTPEAVVIEAAVVEEVKSEDIAEPEKPKEPEPSPTVSSPTPAPSQAAAPSPTKPVMPKTWANMVAGNRIVTPAVPAAPSTVSSIASQPKTAPPAQVQVPATPTAPSVDEYTPQEVDQTGTAQSSGSEWQSVGHEHGRKQTRPQTAQMPVENARAYIKNVTDDIEPDVLKSYLQKFGEIRFFDISRPKNCAFIEFGSSSAYQAAVAANPHEVAGHKILVEERRVKPSGFNGTYSQGRGNGFRGGRGGPDGRPNPQGRGGFQKDGGRGGFPNRGRGNFTQRGRGVPQVA